MRVSAVFGVVALTRVLFRAEDVTAAGAYVVAMFGQPGKLPLSVSAAIALISAALLHFTPTRWRDRFMAYASSRPSWMFAMAFVTVVYLVIVFTRGRGGFIYFQF